MSPWIVCQLHKNNSIAFSINQPSHHQPYQQSVYSGYSSFKILSETETLTNDLYLCFL